MYPCNRNLIPLKGLITCSSSPAAYTVHPLSPALPRSGRLRTSWGLLLLVPAGSSLGFCSSWYRLRSFPKKRTSYLRVDLYRREVKTVLISPNPSEFCLYNPYSPSGLLPMSWLITETVGWKKEIYSLLPGFPLDEAWWFWHRQPP